MKILILDNYDSFTYNLVHIVQSYTEEFEVRRNDEISLEEVDAYDKILLSPGPGLPADAGIMPALIKKYKETKSILGICLGMQAIAECFGAKLRNLDNVLHGIQNDCFLHPGKLFNGLPSTLKIGHYHSWVIDESTMPNEIEITAIDKDGLIMAIRHEKFNIQAVQFHPESVLTPMGNKIIENWLKDADEAVHLTSQMTSEKDKINIAIDGHSSCGKSTLAKALAKKMGYIYIDSGAMFRAVSLFALENDLVKNGKVDDQMLIASLPKIDMSFVNVDGEMKMYLNGRDVENEIRAQAVSNIVSPVSTIKEVRNKLLIIQQNLGKDKGVVMDGRDIGTVVFPDAQLKIFMTASADVRAKRRTMELEKRGTPTPYNLVYQNILDRDMIDSTRKIAPLQKADDAILVDNSNLNPKESLNVVFEHVQKVIG